MEYKLTQAALDATNGVYVRITSATSTRVIGTYQSVYLSPLQEAYHRMNEITEEDSSSVPVPEQPLPRRAICLD